MKNYEEPPKTPMDAPGDGMKKFTRVMKALSDPSRVKMLKILQERTLCVCEIQAAMGIAQPTVSKHLKLLEEAGLVNSFREGLWVNYHIADGSESPFAAALLGNLRHWLEDEPEVREARAALPGLDRRILCGKKSA
jgi:ArsR family transcriptional regulator